MCSKAEILQVDSFDFPRSYSVTDSNFCFGGASRREKDFIR